MNTEIPKAKKYKKRLTQEMRDMKFGKFMELDEETARALYTFLRRKGRAPVIEKQDSGTYKVWRTK